MNGAVTGDAIQLGGAVTVEPGASIGNDLQHMPTTTRHWIEQSNSGASLE